METTAQNRAIVRQYIDAVNLQQHELLYTLVDPGFVDHAPLPGQRSGREGWFETRLARFREAFPDLVYTIDDLIAENDLVVVRGSAEGTHSGAFFGIPATNKRVRWSYTQMFRLKDTLLFECWMDFDLLGIFSQIGAGQKP
jgi:predicted ester cyclase